MNAKELRIGNLIGWYSCTAIDTIKDIKTSEIRNPVINDVNIKDCKPIPLTQKWLEDFGFKPSLFGMSLNEFYLSAGSKTISTNEFGAFAFEVVPEVEYININYVHQLQNLYFAITGEELKLKPSKETNGN